MTEVQKTQRRDGRTRPPPVQKPVTGSGVRHPWDTGDLERNWQGYFIPGTRSATYTRAGCATAFSCDILGLTGGGPPHAN